jgi:hypothetical protein
VPAGTFARAYAANRRIAIEDVIDADPVATCVRELMLERGSWAGRAVDLLRVSADRSRNAAVVGARGRPKNPRALAGRLRRAQTFLRIMGIEVAFTREGRTRARSGRPPSRPQTILTVLTQTQAFVWANGGQG